MGRISMGYEETLPKREGNYAEPGIFLLESRANERSQITSMGQRSEAVRVGLEGEHSCSRARESRHVKVLLREWVRDKRSRVCGCRRRRSPRLSRILTLEELSLGRTSLRSRSQKQPHQHTHICSEQKMSRFRSVRTIHT
jgi:hypothetical protein